MGVEDRSERESGEPGAGPKRKSSRCSELRLGPSFWLVVKGELLMSGQMAELTVLRAAVLMLAGSILSDLRSMRQAKTVEEAQLSINEIIERVNALVDAAERAGGDSIKPG